jgi:hypothetical protein
MGILTSTIFGFFDGVHQAPGGPDENREDGLQNSGWGNTTVLDIEPPMPSSSSRITTR